MASQGVVYVATGSEFVQESVSSARQLKSVMPEIKITLFSNTALNDEVFDNFRSISPSGDGFLDRIRALSKTPYDRTLHLDTDIYVNESVPELFGVLDNFDLAVAPDSHQQPVLKSDGYRAPDMYTGIFDPIPEFNGGLISYKMSPTVREMLTSWERLYDVEAHWADQPALRAAIYESDNRICPLPRRYNFIPGLRNCVSGRVKILHNRLSTGPEPGYKDVPPEQLPQLIKRVNHTEEARVTYPYGGEITHYTDLEVLTADSLPVQLLKSVARRGPKGAARLWLHKLRSQF